MMESSSNVSTPSSHRRHPSSSNKITVNRPRRSTKGPLDIAEGPIGDAGFDSPPSTASQLNSPIPSSIGPLDSTNESMSITERTPKDFSKLLRPEIYHPLPALEVAAPFRTSEKQPSSTTPLETLLANGHFRAAAIACAQRLRSPPLSPADHAQIFSLLYVRLACLTLCHATQLAAQEIKSMEDLNSSLYRDDLTGQHLVPWELRVLAVRLQAIGFNDSRRGVMGYYDLARDARSELSRLKAVPTQAQGSAEILLWEHRLADLGIRVASALVGANDFEAARLHLATLDKNTDHHLALFKALLLLKIGDAVAARHSVSTSELSRNVVGALSHMADGQYDEGVLEWQKLCEQDPENEMYAQNMAVCLLYSGRIDQARSILEKLIENGKSFHALTFNLSTIYELCTDKSREMKMKLTDRVASMPETSDGWEKFNIDFKL